MTTPQHVPARPIGARFDSRMVWFQLLAIPTIVMGCATVCRWPRFRRSVDGSLIE